MKTFVAIFFLILLSSCKGYYKYRNINFVKKSPSKELNKFIVKSKSDSVVFLHYDTVIITGKLLSFSAEDSLIQIRRIELENKTEYLELYNRTEYMNDDMNSSSGKLSIEEEGYLPQTHLIYMDSIFNDSIISLNTKQINKANLIRSKSNSGFLTALLVISIIFIPFLIIMKALDNIGGY